MSKQQINVYKVVRQHVMEVFEQGYEYRRALRFWLAAPWAPTLKTTDLAG